MAHESLQRSEGTGGDLSVLSTRREELSANSCSHNVIFVFRKLELSLENKGKKEVKDMHCSNHSTPRFHPLISGYQCCHPSNVLSPKTMLVKPPKQNLLTTDFLLSQPAAPEHLNTSSWFVPIQQESKKWLSPVNKAQQALQTSLTDSGS